MLFKIYKNKPLNLLIIISIFVILITIVTPAIILFGYARIYRGIYIEDMYVGGLNVQEASDLIKKNISCKYDNPSIVLKYDNTERVLKLEAIAYKIDYEAAVEKAYKTGREGSAFRRLGVLASLLGNKIDIISPGKFDENKLESALEDIKSEVELKPEDAKINYNNGEILIISDLPGKSINIDENIKRLVQKINYRDFTDFEISIKKIDAKIRMEQLTEITSVLAGFETSINISDKARTNNIKHGCDKINGIILMPGEIFSLSKSLGPRTIENGYFEAPVIIKDEIKKAPGGGICQIASTIYNTVLKARLKVVERVNHSILPIYVSPARDATITEEFIDFKFINDSGSPLSISASVSQNKLVITLLGKKSKALEGFTIKLITDIIEVYDPGEDEIIIDESLPPGSAVIDRERRSGIRARLYRDTYDEKGTKIERELISTDTYKAVKKRIKINPLKEVSDGNGQSSE